MKNEQCPPQDDLTAFVRCKVSEQQAEAIAEHVANCPDCEETVVGLEMCTATVFDRLKGMPAHLPFQDEPELNRMAQMARQHPPVNNSDQTDDPARVDTLEQLRDYLIFEKIGEGGMGAVYRAVHTRLKKTVALKVLSSNRLTDETAISRFQREISIIGRLQHPNIVQAHDAGEHDGQHYLVMEYVNGSNLSDIVKRCDPLAIADACQLISQAAAGLQYAHENGFVHRDIKPSNLMLARADLRAGESRAIVKILDLGLARAFDQPAGIASTKVDLTTTGQVMGTLDYMAPEQGSDAHQVDIRSDIYSLGATLYKLLTGDSPYAEHAQKPPLQRLMAIAQNEPPAIRTKRPDVPEKLAEIVHRMLARKPENRFATPDEVVQALAPFSAHADLAALLNPQSGPRIPDVGSTVTLPLKESSFGKETSRRLRTAFAGFVGFAFFAAILLITTRHGTVEVTSPVGPLPDDVQIIVSRGGEEIELLQADNQWSAKIVNGEYQVQLRGGDDQFEIKDSKLSISRMRRVVVIVGLKKPVAEPKPAIAANSSTQPSISSDIANSKHPLSPKSSTTDTLMPTQEQALPDREKPFVVVDSQGQVLREYPFANEAFSLLQPNEILEVHGNGPFRVGQIARQNTTLSIRAGQGYRPRFVVGFEIPAANYEFQSGPVFWFHLDNVKLSIEGCDFIGASCYMFAQFAGSGSQWTFDNCRLIQPPSNVGSLLGFHGEALTVRNSLLSIVGQDGVVARVSGKARLRFEHNVFPGSKMIDLGVDADRPQELVLSHNVFYRALPLMLNNSTQTDQHPVVEAQDNLFIPPYSELFLSVHASAPMPHPWLTWKGRGNRYLPGRTGFLWQRPVPEGEPASGLATVAEWNDYWKSPDDLTQIESVKFAWEIFDQTDWTAGRDRVAAELGEARKRFPELAQLGPDIALVGSGTAFDVARKMDKAAKPASLEGGPFVLLRGEQVVGAFVSIEAAIQQAQDDDVIEVRSDGPFPAVQTGSPIRRITLRAANGFRPGFVQFGTDDKVGEWTLEGLHFRGVPGAPTLWCQARKLINCSCDPVLGDGRIHVQAVPGAEQPLEIINCYFPAFIELRATKVRMDNTVANSVGTISSEVASLDISRSFLWAHESARFNLSAQAVWHLAPAESVIRCTDCLIDAETITSMSNFQWQGDRNLYRISGPRWPVLHPTPDVWKVFYAPGEWQQHWNSDLNSREDDSMLFRKELWHEE